eukprot:PhF_6_TR4458/c0_g1_i1/m.6051
MQRRAPRWFTDNVKRERIRKLWPWGLGLLAGLMYQYNPAPMDDVLKSNVSRVRKPLLKGTELLEKFDMDPEVYALELPPDQLFGPLPLKQQIFFCLQALEEENELGDNYITRVILDHLDFSLDPPALGNSFVEAGGGDLLRQAVVRFRDVENQKIRFFGPDQFVRMVNVAISHKELAQQFMKEPDAVDLLFKAADTGKNPYTPHLVSRALTIMALLQSKDGMIEKRICDVGGIQKLLGWYSGTSGDPQETRFFTCLFSSILRTVPQGPKLFIEADGVENILRGLNTSQYKGLPQHIRVFRDLEDVNPKGVSERLTKSTDSVSILLGVLTHFGDFGEVQYPLCKILKSAASKKDPFEVMQYGGLSVFAKAAAKYEKQPLMDDYMGCVAELAHRVLNDKECQKYKDHSPEIALAYSDMKKFTSLRLDAKGKPIVPYVHPATPPAQEKKRKQEHSERVSVQKTTTKNLTKTNQKQRHIT